MEKRILLAIPIAGLVMLAEAADRLSCDGAAPLPVLLPRVAVFLALCIAVVLLSRYVGRLRLAAETDSLTGLGNRYRFDCLLASKRSGAVGVLYIDVDELKSINDRCGHAAGDALLRRLAEILRTRSPEDSVCCRVGGDEFVVVVPNADEKALAAIRRSILAATLDEFSIGTAVGRFEELESLVAKADAELYKSKGEIYISG